MARTVKLAMLALSGCVFVGLSPLAAQQRSLARVLQNGAAIWRSDVSIIATTVEAGTTLEVTAQSDRWYEVVIPEILGGHGERGLIARSQVQLLPGSPEPPTRLLRGDPPPQAGTSPRAPTRSPTGRRAVSPKGFISLNGIYQATKSNFSDGAAFQANAEEGRFDTNYSLKAGQAFEVAGGAMLSNAFGIGVSVSRFSRTTPAHFTGAIPHPFFFGQSRVVASDISGLKREELAIHLQGRTTIALGKRVQASLFAGPSFFSIRQGAVTDFTYTDSYPYDQATFTSATTDNEKASKMGFNGGGDLAFFFTRRVGVGFTAQVSKATVSIKSAGSGNTEVKAGGVQTGGGLRLRF